MANEVCQPGLPTGLTLTLKVFAPGSATIVATSATSEAPTGCYSNSGSLSALAIGSTYQWEMTDGSGVIWATSGGVNQTWTGSALVQISSGGGGTYVISTIGQSITGGP